MTSEEKDGRTLLILHELYPSKEALDESIAGMEGRMSGQFEQLDELLVALNVGRFFEFADPIQRSDSGTIVNLLSTIRLNGTLFGLPLTALV